MKAFGEPVIFSPVAGPDVAITAVFTDSDRLEKWSDGEKVIEECTSLGCQESQFITSPYGAVPEENDLFTARGRLWRAVEVMTDGHGHVKIHIMLASNDQANMPLTPPVG